MKDSIDSPRALAKRIAKGLSEIAFQFSTYQRICFGVLRKAILDLTGNDPEEAASARYFFNHNLHKIWCECVGLDPVGVFRLVQRACFLEDRFVSSIAKNRTIEAKSQYPVIKRPKLEAAGFLIGRDMVGKVSFEIIGQFVLAMPPDLARMVARALDDEAGYAENDLLVGKE